MKCIPNTIYVKPTFPTRNGCYFFCSLVKRAGYVKMSTKSAIGNMKNPYWLCFDLVNGDAYEKRSSDHNYVWAHYSQLAAERRYQKHAKNRKYAALSTPKYYFIVES